MAGKRILTCASRRQGGLTLVEVAMALAVLSLTLVGLVAGISYASRTNGVILEDEAAMRGAQKMIETMRSYPLKFIWVCFNNNPNDASALSVSSYGWTSAAYPEWDNNTGTGVGTNAFSVEGLTPIGDTVGGDTWTTCGRIYFPGNNTAGACTLVEITDPTNPLYDALGTDLNANNTPGETLNVTTGPPTTSPYNILPVTLSIRWKGISGKRTMTFRYILTGPQTSSTSDFKFTGQP